MNRLTVGVLVSFIVVFSVTAVKYSAEPISAEQCQLVSGCQKGASACGKSGWNKQCSEGVKTACGQKSSCGTKAFKTACSQKSGCGNQAVACAKPNCCKKVKSSFGPNCTKPWCAGKQGV